MKSFTVKRMRHRSKQQELKRMNFLGSRFTQTSMETLRSLHTLKPHLNHKLLLYQIYIHLPNQLHPALPTAPTLVQNLASFHIFSAELNIKVALLSEPTVVAPAEPVRDESVYVDPSSDSASKVASFFSGPYHNHIS